MTKTDKFRIKNQVQTNWVNSSQHNMKSLDTTWSATAFWKLHLKQCLVKPFTFCWWNTFCIPQPLQQHWCSNLKSLLAFLFQKSQVLIIWQLRYVDPNTRMSLCDHNDGSWELFTLKFSKKLWFDSYTVSCMGKLELATAGWRKAEMCTKGTFSATPRDMFVWGISKLCFPNGLETVGQLQVKIVPFY